MSHEADDDEGPGNSETSSLTEPSQGTDESVQAFREQAPFIAKYIPDCLHLAFLTMLVIFFLASRLRRHPGRIRTTPGHGVLQVHAPVHGQFPRLRLAIFQMRDHGSNGEFRDRARPHGFLFTAATCLKPACISFPSSILTWTSPLFTSQCPGAVLAWAGRATLWTVHSNATIS